MNAGSRVTQEAKAEAGIHYKPRNTAKWIPAYAGMTNYYFTNFIIPTEAILNLG